MPNESRVFDGMATLITGAASGIGRGVAEHFAALGARVAVVDLKAQEAEAVAAGIAAAGGEARAYAADVADASAVTAMVGEVASDFGRIDHLINSAGVSLGLPLAELTEQAYAATLDVDLGGIYRVSRAAAPHLAATGEGAIVNIASVMAWYSAPGYVAYSAAKAGVLGMTRALALELGPAVRANTICPGYIDTAIWHRNLAEMESAAAAAYAERVRARHPVGRRGRPEDIAAAAAFLCSRQAGFITGTELLVDGGVSINALAQSGIY